MKYSANNKYIYILFEKEDFKTTVAQRCIHAIKECIPASDRRYDKESKVWTLSNNPKYRVIVSDFFNLRKTIDSFAASEGAADQFLSQFDSSPHPPLAVYR